MRVTAKPLTGPVPNRKRMAAETMVVTWVSMMVVESVSEALIDGSRRRFAGTQLFTNTLEDEHVGVDAHTDGEDDAGDARQRQQYPVKPMNPSRITRLRNSARSALMPAPR